VPPYLQLAVNICIKERKVKGRWTICLDYMYI